MEENMIKNDGEQEVVLNEVDVMKDQEGVMELKVKADPEDVSADDRKRNVKRLAGAISHALRNSGEVNVRAFGAAAIAKSAKSLAIAYKYVEAQGLHLGCAPAFITAKIGDNELTGMCFHTFTTKIRDDQKNKDYTKAKSVLKVTADPKDIAPEDRKSKLKALASAIAHAAKENNEVLVRCFGSSSISKAVKSISVARGKIALTGMDLYAFPMFIVADMNGNERTGIAFYVYTNMI
jgi:stage V sporulation protein SpoVS